MRRGVAIALEILAPKIPPPPATLAEAINRQRRNAAELAELGRRPPPGAHVTPGTRIAFVDLATWIAGAQAIDDRRGSDARNKACTAHVRALPTDLVARSTDVAALAQLPAMIDRLHMMPPRGRRAGSDYERLIVARNNRLAQLARLADERSLGVGDNWRRQA